jgi:hypothetical protein
MSSGGKGLADIAYPEGFTDFDPRLKENFPDLANALIEAGPYRLENKCEHLFLSDVNGLEDNVALLIRNTYWPFGNFPVAVVDCKCGSSYKKALFYQKQNSFFCDETLKCPECSHKIEFHYSNQ